MEVLTAFVRQNAPIIKENESQSPEDQEKFLELRISIQACLTVIAERKHPDLENKYIDLTEVNISGFNLYGANLKGAVLFSANLKGAVLTGAYRLEPDWITEVLLTEADLKGAILTGATMPDGSIHN